METETNTAATMSTPTNIQQVDESPESTVNLLKLKENMKVVVDKLNEIVKVNCLMLEKIQHLSEENSKLHEANDNLYDELFDQKIALTSLDQYGRRENVEFVNIPESVSQDQLQKHVMEVMKTIKINVTDKDIHAIHRIGKASSRPRNVIVRFVNRKTAFKLLKNKKKLKNTSHKNYYITENLCPYNKQIFNKLYKHKKNKAIHSLWSFNGNVFCKVREEDERVQVQHLDEIDDLFRADDSGEDDSDEEAVSNSITTEEPVDHPDNMKQDHRRRSMSLRRQSGLHPTRRLSLVAEEESDNSLLRTPIPPLVIQV